MTRPAFVRHDQENQERRQIKVTSDAADKRRNIEALQQELWEDFCLALRSEEFQARSLRYRAFARGIRTRDHLEHLPPGLKS